MNSYQLCVNSHRNIMQELEIPQEQIDELEAFDHLTKRERLALKYTESMIVATNRVSDNLFDQLKDRLTQEEIVELTFLIGFINMLNMFNNALQVTLINE